MRKQREKENYWGKHKDHQTESSSDEPNFAESYADGRSFDEENLEMDNRGGGGTMEGLEDNYMGVQLEVKKQCFRPVWKDYAGEYL